MISRRGQLVIGFVGLMLVVGFFLPWLRFGGLLEASGLDLVSQDGLPSLTRFLLAMCPVGGAAMVLAALGGSRVLGTVSAIVGGGTLAYGGYKVFQILLATIGLGLWMVTFAALAALILGLYVRRP